MTLSSPTTLSGRRTTKYVLPEDIKVWASLQPVFHRLRLLHVQWVRRSATWPNSCVLIVVGLGEQRLPDLRCYAVWSPEVFVYYGQSVPVVWRLGDGVSEADEMGCGGVLVAW